MRSYLMTSSFDLWSLSLKGPQTKLKLAKVEYGKSHLRICYNEKRE